MYRLNIVRSLSRSKLNSSRVSWDQMNNMAAHESWSYGARDSDRTIFPRNCPTNWPTQRLRANRSECHCLTTSPSHGHPTNTSCQPFHGRLHSKPSYPRRGDTFRKIIFRVQTSRWMNIPRTCSLYPPYCTDFQQQETKFSRTAFQVSKIRHDKSILLRLKNK